MSAAQLLRPQQPRRLDRVARRATPLGMEVRAQDSTIPLRQLAVDLALLAQHRTLMPRESQVAEHHALMPSDPQVMKHHALMPHDLQMTKRAHM